MSFAQFRPCIDLHDGQVKQIIGSTLNEETGEVDTNFVSTNTPEYYSELYKKDNLPGGHVIMLGGGNAAAAKQALNTWRGGLQLGGGINPDNARKWIDEGASGVIVTSYVFSDGELKLDRLEKLYDAVGKDNLILDLSCRKLGEDYYIVTNLWQKFTTMKVNVENLSFMADFCREFLIHAVDVEGKQAGIDQDLLKLLAANATIPCVYAGGIKSLEDIEIIQQYGHGKIHYTVGSALDIFGGELPYRDVVDYHNKLKKENS